MSTTVARRRSVVPAQSSKPNRVITHASLASTVTTPTIRTHVETEAIVSIITQGFASLDQQLEAARLNLDVERQRLQQEKLVLEAASKKMGTASSSLIPSRRQPVNPPRYRTTPEPTTTQTIPTMAHTSAAPSTPTTVHIPSTPTTVHTPSTANSAITVQITSPAPTTHYVTPSTPASGSITPDSDIPSPLLVSRVADLIKASGIIPTKESIWEYVKEKVKELIPIIVRDALLSKNHDWEGSGKAYSDIVVSILMGDRENNGPLSLHLIEKWFFEGGPGYRLIQQIIATDIGTYIPPLTHKISSPRGTAGNMPSADVTTYKYISDVIMRTQGLMSYAEASSFSVFLDGDKIVGDPDDVYPAFIRMVFDFSLTIFAPSARDVLMPNSILNSTASPSTGPKRVETDITVGPGLGFVKVIVKIEGEIKSPIHVYRAGDTTPSAEYPIMTAVAKHYLMFFICDYYKEGKIELEHEKVVDVISVEVL